MLDVVCVTCVGLVSGDCLYAGLLICCWLAGVLWFALCCCVVVYYVVSLWFTFVWRVVVGFVLMCIV